ncbi:MAG: outer membrane beta-barrel protein [Elusimicrobia bacterium]|nr:outer membrane beta-barrel protein [Elusimicrobiota bacterium]MDY6040082.1 outer membrane beta-barrel protein [Elusimicrobiaceae bacterium]
MKKIFAFLFALCCTSAPHAETLKMKNGDLITGSILSQTEYTLNLATSYGNITLNQREIEEILPDKHRLILKGGTQLVGVILDMDEFNLKLQTDDGSTVNVDMPQIVTIEMYDYDRGEKAQQQIVEQQIERQQQQAAAQAQAAVRTETKQVEAAGGLSFDSDIDQVFDAKKATVVNGAVVTPSAAVQQAAPRPLTDEEAFLRNVKSGQVTQQEYAAAAKEELAAKKPTKQEAKPAVKQKEKNFSKYFSVQAGAMPLDLKLSNSARPGFETEDGSADVGGTSVAVSSKFLWRVKESNLWLGPVLGVGNVPNNSFEDRDQAVLDANDKNIAEGKEPSYPDPTVKTSGQILTFGAAAHYYVNPESRFAFYLAASAAYEMLKLNYRGEMNSKEINSNGFAGSAGLGVETWVDDVMVGLEVRQVFAKRSDDLKDSSASNTVIQAQLSWKF